MSSRESFLKLCKFFAQNEASGVDPVQGVVHLSLCGMEVVDGASSLFIFISMALLVPNNFIKSLLICMYWFFVRTRGIYSLALFHSQGLEGATVPEGYFIVPFFNKYCYSRFIFVQIILEDRPV